MSKYLITWRERYCAEVDIPDGVDPNEYAEKYLMDEPEGELEIRYLIECCPSVSEDSAK
jgi:hypothetical protein